MNLTWRRAIVLGVALATLAALPIVRAPWDEDEVFLTGAVQGTSPWMNTRFDAYRFSSGEPSAVAALIASGKMPWYTATDFKYALYRPLTSALLWLDSLVFGGHRSGYQLDALAWHAALIVAAGLVLRRAMPSIAGRATLLLFAVSVVHTTAVGWLTARHVLVAAVPAMFGLLAHLRWREDRWKPGLPIALALFGAALLASEAGTQVLAYVLAYAACRQDERLQTRMLAVAPYVVLVVAYVVLYKLLGRGHDYGATFASPGEFVTTGLPRLFLHGAVLLGASLRPDNGWGFYALRPTILVAIPAVVLAVPAIRRLPEPDRRGATWLAVGAVLALVPVAGAPLESRVLVAPSLGAAAVVAAILVAGVRSARGKSESTSLRALFIAGALALASVHVVLAPIELPQHYLAMVRQREQRLGTFVRAARGDLANADVLVVGSPHFLVGQLGGYLRERVTGQRVGRWVAIADANCTHRLERVSLQAVAIEPMCRPEFFPYGRLETDDEIRQLDWTVHVTRGHPNGRFEIRFDRPIEQTPARFVTFEGFADKLVPLPPVGESIVLPEAVTFADYGIDDASRWMHTRFGQ